MNRPDNESLPFVARWHSFIRVLLVPPSVKGVARAAMDHADFMDGTGVYAGNERLARVTGYSARAVQSAWAAMRCLGIADRVGRATPDGKNADTYNLVIPDGWKDLPTLGPNEGRFHCIHCDHVFNPSTNALVVNKDGSHAWYVGQMVFCPPPQRRKNGPVPESCESLWSREQKRRGNGGLREHDVWKLFRQARGDDW